MPAPAPPPASSRPPAPGDGDFRLLRALDELGRIAVARTDLHELARDAVAVIKENLGLAFVALGRVDEAQGEYAILAVAADFDSGLDASYTQSLELGLIGRCAREGRTIFVADVRREADYIAAIPGIIAEIVLPIKVDGKVFAILDCESREADGFAGRTLLLELVAARLGVALENAALLRERESALAHSAGRAKQLELLNEIARIATEDLELAPMLQRITDTLARKFGWEFVACALIDEVQGRFRIAAVTTEMKTGVYVGYGRALGSGVVGEVAATGKPLLLDDVHTHANYVDTFPGAQSELCVPVFYNSKLVAVLNLESIRRAEFHDQLPLLTTVADQVAGAIGSAQLYEQARRHAGQLELLDEVSRLAMLTPDLQALLDQVTAYVVERFGLEIAGLLLLDDAGEMLEFAASAGNVPVNVVRGSRWPVSDGALGRCVRRGEAQFLADVHADPDYIAINAEVKSEFHLPIVNHGRILGALSLGSTRAEAFSADSQAVLRLIVDQIAGALARARLVDLAMRRGREMEVLSEISRTALDAGEIGMLLNRICSFIQGQMGLELTAILLLDEKEKQIELVAQSSTLPLSITLGARRPVGTGIVGRAVVTGEPQLQLDVHADPDYLSMNDDVKAEYAVPIRFQGKITGVMNFESKDPAQFNPETLRLLRTFVDQVAGAIHLATVNRRLSDVNVTLTELFSRFVAPDLAKALLENPERFSNQGERREVSVLFADIRGFTAMSQKLDSQALLTLLNEFFEMMGGAIFAQRGSINRYLGDGLMAVFGVPVILPGHAGAAVRAAFAMQRACDQLSPRWEMLTGKPLKVVVAINSGEVVAGNLGDPRHMEFTVLGDTVNVASRLETEAKARDARILVTGAVYKTITNDLTHEPLGEIELRGREGKVPIYKLM